MNNSHKSKDQLINEIYKLTQRISELESFETKHILIEKALETERDNLKNILDSMPDGVYIVNQQYEIEYINPVIENNFGPVEGRKCYEYFHDKKEVCPWCKNQEVFKGKSIRWEWFSPKNNKYYDLFDTPIKNKDNSISKLELFHDITELKELENERHAYQSEMEAQNEELKTRQNEIEKSNIKYSNLYDQAPVGYLSIDHKGLIHEANLTFSNYVGLDNKSLIKKAFINFINKKDILTFNSHLIDTFKSSTRQVCEVKLITKNNLEMYVQLDSILFKDSTDTNLCKTIVTNITERKVIEKALQTSRERFVSLIDTIVDTIITIDENGKILLVNRTVKDMFGYDIKEALNQNLNMLIPNFINHLNTKSSLNRQITDDGSIIWKPLDLIGQHKNGKKFPVELSFGEYKENHKHLLTAVIRDISERVKIDHERKKSTEKLLKAMEDTVHAIAKTVEIRDPYTAGHQRRVAELACAIANEIGLSDNKIEGLRMASIIHDLGKINIPIEVLSKPGRLSNIEFNLVKTHVENGYNVLKHINFPWPVADIVRQHHEKWNGSGYPIGLSGKAILLEARILNVADVVEAMASHRPYRAALGIYKALDEISINKNILYDPCIVDICTKIIVDNKFNFEYDENL
ncbi:MAG: PAS domain S-box protein [Spirochaetota bacterium]|nr:PAS domain S-box protein [Spirochaetota bacterium]